MRKKEGKPAATDAAPAPARRFFWMRLQASRALTRLAAWILCDSRDRKPGDPPP